MVTPPFSDLEFLGLPVDASLEQLRATRNALVKEFHPDRYRSPEEKAVAHEETVRINAAYERVRDWLEAEAEAKSRAAAQTPSDAAEPKRREEAEAEARRKARAQAQQEESARWESGGQRDQEAGPGAAPGGTGEQSPPSRGQSPRFAAAAMFVMLGGCLVYLGFKFIITGSVSDPAITQPAINAIAGIAEQSALVASGTRWEQSIKDILDPPLLGSDGTLYVASKDGTIRAILVDSGAVRWSFKLDGTPSILKLEPGDFRSKGSRIIVASTDNRVFAVDAATGAKQWEFRDADPANALLVGAGTLVYVESKAGVITAQDSTTGAKRWEYRTGSGSVSPGLRPPSPTLGPNAMLYTTFTAVTKDARGNNHVRQSLIALEGSSGKPLWESPVSLLRAAPLALDGVVYACTGSRVLQALNGNNGVTLWEARLEERRPVNGTPWLVTNQTVYVQEQSGWKIYAVDQASGLVRWEFHPGRPCFARGIGADGVVLVWSAPNLCVLNPANGAKLWERTLSGTLTANAIGSSGIIHLGTSNGDLLALDASNGATLWEFHAQNGAHFVSIQVGPDSSVYTTSSNGRLTAFPAVTRRNTTASLSQP